MSDKEKNLTKEELEHVRERGAVAARLQEIESNPFDAEDEAMYAMFDREGWSHERRIAYIKKRAREDALVPAAE